MRIITFLLSVMLVALMNVAFVGVHYGADRAVSVETVKQRINAAVASDNITPEEYPWKTAGFASPLNTIGMNKLADCLMDLKMMHRDANPVLNAISPAYYRTERNDQVCDVVKALAEGKVTEKQLQKRSRYFFWYGAKPVTQWLLVKFDYYQIYQLIRQLSYFFIALLLAAAFARSSESGLAFVPVAGLAILGSGLPYNGGIVFALPYLSALVLSLGYYLIQSRDEERTAREIFYLVFAGSVQAFFAMLDGSVILVSALLMFGIYFMDRVGRPAGKRMKRMLGLMLVFYLSFVASLLIKQGFAGAFSGFDTVWDSLQAKIPTLFGWGVSSGSGLGLRSSGASSNALDTLFAQYAFSMFGHGGVARYVQFGGLIAWALAGLLALVFALARHTGRPLLDMLAFGLIGLMALARFILLPPDTPEMALFVGRYWFIVIALGLSALVWMVASYRYRGTRTEKLLPAAEEAPDTPEASQASDEPNRESAGAATQSTAKESTATRAPEQQEKPEPKKEMPVAPEQPEVKEKPVAKGDRVLPEKKAAPEPVADTGLVSDAKPVSVTKTETTKERSRLTIEVPRFLDGS